jgi:hypothetical protein
MGFLGWYFLWGIDINDLRHMRWHDLICYWPSAAEQMRPEVRGRE